MLGLSKVTKNASDIWQLNSPKTDDKRKQILIQATLDPILSKIVNSEFLFLNQLFKLIWECGLSFSAGDFKNGKKKHWMLDNNFFDTLFEASLHLV